MSNKKILGRWKLDGSMKEKKSYDFTKKLLTLVFPIAFQQFMLALVSASDALMLGMLTAFMLKLPVLAVYFIVNLDEIVKLPAVYRHYKKYKWVKDLTVHGGMEGTK